MGFEMKESIALFSQWEKSGVNTEIAFSGLKKLYPIGVKLVKIQEKNLRRH